jgi:hypothetical protein
VWSCGVRLHEDVRAPFSVDGNEEAIAAERRMSRCCRLGRISTKSIRELRVDRGQSCHLVMLMARRIGDHPEHHEESLRLGLRMA